MGKSSFFKTGNGSWFLHLPKSRDVYLLTLRSSRSSTNLPPNLIQVAALQPDSLNMLLTEREPFAPLWPWTELQYRQPSASEIISLCEATHMLAWIPPYSRFNECDRPRPLRTRCDILAYLSWPRRLLFTRHARNRAEKHYPKLISLAHLFESQRLVSSGPITRTRHHGNPRRCGRVPRTPIYGEISLQTL